VSACVCLCPKCASGGFSAPLRRGLAPVAPACQGYVPLAVRRAVQRPASPPTPASVGSQHFCCSAPRRADGAVPAPSQLGTRFSFSPPLPLSSQRGFGFARRRFGVSGAVCAVRSPGFVDCRGRLGISPWSTWARVSGLPACEACVPAWNVGSPCACAENGNRGLFSPPALRSRLVAPVVRGYVYSVLGEQFRNLAGYHRLQASAVCVVCGLRLSE